MLKILPWRVMAWGCSIGVLAGLLAVAFELVQGQICEYNQATEHEECTTYSLVPFLLIQVGKPLNDYGVAITALATVAIGFFTLTLKLSTDRLWIAGEKQRMLSEDTAHRQLRAYLLPSGGTISVPGMDHMIISFINNGQTPAYNVGAYSARAVVDFPLPDNAVFSMTDIERGSFDDIGAAGERNIESFFTLSPEDRNAVSNLEKAIFFWGMIEYLDIFKRETRTTEFRLYYGGDFCSTDGRMTIAKKGNKST